jgi:hypothetical protein
VLLNPEPDRLAPLLHNRYADAAPFPHVVIDNFFADDFAEQLVDQFPPFAGDDALSEFGKQGKKSVNSDFKAIGTAYAQLEEFLDSEAFTRFITEVTGLVDPILVMQAGGTQESLNGADLAPHLDYNFMDWQGEVLHRRLNILVYLNKDWQEAWGGNFEVHSNPWQPEANTVHRYAPVFNRAIIMETSERSWHGHDLIWLPDPNHQSRKSISVYLFSKVQSAADLPIRRSTFYATRQLSRQLEAGHVLTPEDVDMLQTALSKRDLWIQHYQSEVLRFSQKAEKQAKRAAWLKQQLDQSSESQ